MGVLIVTGATGFVGQNLLRHLQLLDRPVDVVGVGRNRKILAKLATTIPSFTAVEADLSDPRFAEEVADLVAARPVDGVVHLASLVAPPGDDVGRCVDLLRANGKGTIAMWRLIERLRAVTSVASVVHVSSILVYGKSAAQPAREDQPLSPSDVYGASKVAGELYAQYFSRLLGVPLAILRLGFVYGPLDSSGKVIYRFAAAAQRHDDIVITSDPSVHRDYVHVEDVCRVIAHMIGDPRPGCRVVNVSAGRSVSLLELAETIRRAIGSATRIRVERPRVPLADPFYGCTVADTALLRNLIGEPTDLSLGLARLMESSDE